MSGLEEAIDSFKAGDKVLIFDSSEREGETDIVAPANDVDYEDIVFLREKGGGLVCVTIPYAVCESLGLPYLSEVLGEAGFGESDIPYGEKSSFSVLVNHKDTFTGITDRDRALTARKLSETYLDVVNGNEVVFENRFRVPGHVPILKGSRGLLENREGHTELSMALAEMANVIPVLVVCEILDSETGDSLSFDEAKRFANNKQIPIVKGEKIIENY